MEPYKTSPLAHAYVGNYQGAFSDRLEGVPRYLKGMKIWIRRWDGRPVFGGMFYHDLSYFKRYTIYQAIP